MTEQLPVINAAKNVTTAKASSATLLGRGLATIQSQKLVIADQEKHYREARDIYNRITDYGCERRFNNETMPKRSEQPDLFQDNLLLQLQPYFDMLQQLADVYKVFQQLAEKGYGKAYFPLALMYQGGQGISADIEKANYYSRLAFDWCFANQAMNDPEIWTDLGWMYDHEIGVVLDEDKRDDIEDAITWYQEAAEQGYAIAKYHLGRLYEEGPQNGYLCYDQDNELAASYYRDAAKQGYAPAQSSLAFMYLEGRGVEQNDYQAIFWYLKAAEQEDEDAQEKLTELRISWKD